MDLTASQITADCLLILRSRNCTVRRQNNHATRGRQNNVTPGVPDICGHNNGTGLAVYVEVKKKGDVLSKAQIIFLTQAYDSKCLVLIATELRGKTVLVDFKEYIKD